MARQRARIRNMRDGDACTKLQYPDTSRKQRIAYPIRIGYGYMSDTPRICILEVSKFFLFLRIRDTWADTYQPCGYVSGWEEEERQGGKRRRETEGEQAEVEEGGAERRRSAGQGTWRLRRGPCCGGMEGR
jgi:hypothetical protein